MTLDGARDNWFGPWPPGVAQRGRRRGADGGTAAARAPLSVAARASASDIPSASSVPSVSQSRSPGIRLTSWAGWPAQTSSTTCPPPSSARVRASQRARRGEPAPLPDQPRDAQRDPDDREQDQGIEERHTHALGGYFLLAVQRDRPAAAERDRVDGGRDRLQRVDLSARGAVLVRAPERVVDLLADARLLEVGVGLVDLGELGLRLVDRRLHPVGQADRGHHDLDALEVLAAEVLERSVVERFADRLLDLDEVRVRRGAGLLVERAALVGEQRARGDQLVAAEAPERLAQRVVQHGPELRVEERAEALVALPRMQAPGLARHRIRAVAEARVELLDERVVLLAGEAGGEGDLRLEPDVDAVGGRDAQVVDADAVTTPGRARDDVAPRRALRRIQARVLRQPAGPGETRRGRDQLALGLLVERAAVVDDTDLVRPGRARLESANSARMMTSRPIPIAATPNATPRFCPGGRPTPPRRRVNFASSSSRAICGMYSARSVGLQDYHPRTLAGVV